MEDSNYANNDNFDPWTPLGLATAVILNRIRIAQTLRELASEQKEARGENHQCDNQAEERPEQNREYVEGRLNGVAKMKGGNF